MLTKGQVGTATTVVTSQNTAKAVGSGSLEVFATPMMVALMEEAACNCVASGLETGQTTVGTQVTISHTAATPLGATVTATAKIINVDGRKIYFDITAHDGTQEIGSGVHQRFVVDAERFMGKLQKDPQ